MTFKSIDTHAISNQCNSTYKKWVRFEKVVISHGSDRLILKQKKDSPENDMIDFRNIAFDIKDDIKTGLESSFQNMRDNIDDEKLTESIEAGSSVDQVYYDSNLIANEETFNKYEAAILGAFLLGGGRSRKVLQNTVDSQLTGKREVIFEAKHRSVDDYIKKYTGEKITAINQTQLENVRLVFADAYKNGHSVNKIKTRLKQSVGLNNRQMKALQNREAKLLKSGMSKTQTDKALKEYHKKLLGQRAEMIAKTEASFIKNHALDLVVQQNYDLVNQEGMTLHKKWAVSLWDRACPICQGIDGDEVPYPENFNGGYFKPPVHPVCYCEINLFYKVIKLN